jgi:hypothetical protein
MRILLLASQENEVRTPREEEPGKGFAPEESDRAAMTGPGYYSKHGRQAVSTVTGHTIQDWKAPVNDVSLSI